MAYKTRAVAASAYPARSIKATLTHVVDTKTGLPLCKGVKPASILDDRHATDENEPATCPTCSKRDPRSQSGGPFSLSSMFQF